MVLDGSALSLRTDSTQIEYLDKEVATPDKEITDDTWAVDSVFQKGGASMADWAAPATMQFSSDGAVSLFTGCNSGSGGYTLDDQLVRFANLAYSKESCVDPLSEALENAWHQVVSEDKWLTWSIDDVRLRIDNGDIGLGLRNRSNN